MKWLLTTATDVSLEALRHEVEAAGGRLESEEPVPLDGNEQVIYADGPEDLHKRLAATPLPVKASPSSELDLY
jgi:hypothetical protein